MQTQRFMKGDGMGHRRAFPIGRNDPYFPHSRKSLCQRRQAGGMYTVIIRHKNANASSPI